MRDFSVDSLVFCPMIIETFLVCESAWTEWTTVYKAVIEMLCFNMILGTGHNFMRELITNSTMIFAIIELLEKLNQVFRIRYCGA